MKVEEVIVQQILDEMENGVVPWHKPWTTHLPSNADDRPYTGINRVVLSLMQSIRGYNHHVWVTYNRAKQEGWNVAKGEKGTKIVFWKPIEHDVVDDQGNLTGETYTRGFYRYYTVFNLAQCENPPAVEDTVHIIREMPHADTVLDGYKDKPRVSHGSDRAAYSPTMDKVVMPNKEDFDSEEKYYHTLFHELAHSTGHKSRLNRSSLTETAAFGSEVYAKEELIAEFASAFMSQHCGITVDIESSASYIDNWKRYIKKDPKAVLSAASMANKASDYILNY